VDWSAVTARVVVEAAAAHPDDLVLDLGCGRGALALALAPRVREVVAFDEVDHLPRPLPHNLRVATGPLGDPPVARASVVVMNDALRRLPPPGQSALIALLGRSIPPRGLLVVGDVMWSMPPAMIDEPGQYGAATEHAPEVATVERQLRSAGFLPDTHRFGVGRAVIIALRG